MKHNTIGRLSVALAALAASLVVTGSALADGSIRPDDRATHGTGAVALETAVVRPDDRATHGSGAVVLEAAIVRPDDRASHGPGSLAAVTPTFVASPSRSGFDWMDAGVGAATVIGIGLLGAGASLLVLRNRRRPAFS